MNLRQIFNLLPLLASVSILASVLFRHSTYDERCDSLLSTGRWTFQHDAAIGQDLWQPFSSILHHYDSASIQKCIDDQTLYFIGDSTIRQLYWAAAEKLGGDDAEKARAEAGKHEDLVYRNNHTMLSFLWDPYINRSESLSTLDFRPGNMGKIGVLLSTGLWHARHGGDDFLQEYNITLDRAFSRLRHDSSIPVQVGNKAPQRFPVIVVPPPHLNFDWLNPARASSLTKPRVLSIVDHLARTEASLGLEVSWSARELTRNNYHAIDGGGLHVTEAIANIQVDLLLNKLCNDKVFHHSNKASSFACVAHESWTMSWGLALAFVLVTSVYYVWCRLQQPCQELPWVQVEAAIVMLLIACHCWLADRNALLEKSTKIVSENLFVLFAAACVCVGVVKVFKIPTRTTTTLSHTKVPESLDSGATELLPRLQTEEWKGWMQIIILLYHYFGMSKVLWVYRIIRVLVAAYLFMTGYGHAMYFQKKEDFSLRRVITVLLRLNLLACLLAVIMNTTYDFYYFPGLSSLWFLITYATFWRPEKRSVEIKELLLRIVASILVVKAVLSAQNILTIMFSTVSVLHGPKIDAKEFIFRVGLDVYSPYFGMLLAMFEHIRTQHGRPLLRLESSMSKAIVRATVIVVAFSFFAVYFSLGTKFEDKYAYNKWHSFLSLLPISAYVLLRNVSQTTRSYVASLFVWIGSFSLELFILQYHIWLANDTKGLLRLGLIDSPRFASGKTVAGSWTFWLESLVLTVIFVWISQNCARVTDVLVKWFVETEGDRKQQQRNLLFRTGILLGVLWLFNLAAAADNSLLRRSRRPY